jgi:hypothetical protein
MEQEEGGAAGLTRHQMLPHLFIKNLTCEDRVEGSV